MTEHTFNQPNQTSHLHSEEQVIHSCQHHKEGEGKWNKAKEKADEFKHEAAEKTGSMWEATKDVTAKAWEKTKEVGSDTWEATKNFAGNVGDALTGQDDEDITEEYYSKSTTEYLDDEENERLNRENKRINDEYNKSHHSMHI